jgi:hypothetical protein
MQTGKVCYVFVNLSLKAYIVAVTDYRLDVLISFIRGEERYMYFSWCSY